MQYQIVTHAGYVPHLDSTRNPITGDIYIAVTKATAAGPVNCEIIKRAPSGQKTIVAVFAEDTRQVYPAGVPVYVVGKAGHCALEWTPEGIYCELSLRVDDEYSQDRQSWVEVLLSL